jgi:hypothetical protein
MLVAVGGGRPNQEGVPTEFDNADLGIITNKKTVGDIIHGLFNFWRPWNFSRPLVF